MIIIEFLDGQIREYPGVSKWEIEGPVLRLNSGPIFLLANIRGWELKTETTLESRNMIRSEQDG